MGNKESYKGAFLCFPILHYKKILQNFAPFLNNRW